MLHLVEELADVLGHLHRTTVSERRTHRNRSAYGCRQTSYSGRAGSAWLCPAVSKFSSQPLCATVGGRHEPAGDDGVDRRGIDAIANAHAIFHHHRAEAEVVQMLVAHVRC